MPLYLLIVVIVAGMLVSYLTDLNYLKNLRSQKEGIKPIELCLCNIFFGGPVLLLFQIFDDFRLDDQVNKRIFLIAGIILTVIQLLLVILLFYFRLITFASPADTSSALISFINY